MSSDQRTCVLVLPRGRRFRSPQRQMAATRTYWLRGHGLEDRRELKGAQVIARLAAQQKGLVSPVAARRCRRLA